MDQRIRMA